MQTAADLFARYREAEKLLAAGDLQKAAGLTQEILSADPGFAYGYHLMASCFRVTGDLNQATAFAEMAVARAPEVALFHMALGQIRIIQKDWKAATADFKRAHQIEPRHPMHLLLLAHAQAEQGNYLEALKLCDRARACADIPLVDEYEGGFRMSLGDYAAAENFFDRLIEREPKSEKGYAHKAELFLRLGRHEDAEEYFIKALGINPKSYEVLQGMSLVHFHRQKLPEAAAFAAQAVAINPFEWKSAMLLGELWLIDRKYAAAEQMLKKVLLQCPDDVRARRHLITALLGQQKKDEVREMVKQVLAKKPDDPILKYFDAMLNGEHLNTAPPEYVAGLFDSYADAFDGHLQLLQYNVPVEIAALLRHLNAGRTDLSLLDLGCGTGKMAEACKEFTGLRVGVDLAPKMLEKSKNKQIYDSLHHADIVQFMRASDRRFDLITAADVLVYVGDLAGTMQAVRRMMNNESLFAFSIESEDGDGFHLHPTGRYSHSLNYVQKTASDAGLVLVTRQDVVLRMENQEPVAGSLLIFKKTQVN